MQLVVLVATEIAVGIAKGGQILRTDIIMLTAMAGLVE